MTWDYESNRYTLSSGRRFYSHHGILGLRAGGSEIADSDADTLFEGYDGCVGIDSEESNAGLLTTDASLLPEERAEIATMMIERWRKWGGLP